MPDTPEFLAQRLRIEGNNVITFFRSLPAENWELPLYTGGNRWNVRDVVAHFLSAEISFLQLLKNIQVGGPELPENFSIDQYNDEQVSALCDMKVDRLLNDFYKA